MPHWRVKMRRLIIWNMVTLDGFIEGHKPWEVDWHELVWGEELEQLSIDQLKSADMLLFGRVTYQGMASYWPSATGEVADMMNSISKLASHPWSLAAAIPCSNLARRD